LVIHQQAENVMSGGIEAWIIAIDHRNAMADTHQAGTSDLYPPHLRPQFPCKYRALLLAKSR